MKVKELKDFLINIPEEAEIYIEADHGQQKELAHTLWIYISDNKEELPYYGDELDFIELEEFEDYEEDPNYDKIRAVYIGY